MEIPRPVRCTENEEVALYLWRKRQEMAAEPKGISDKLDATLAVAYRHICDAKVPIKTLKELSQVKGVGKWLLRLMQGVFPKDDGEQKSERVAEKGKKTRGSKRYLPQKNSVAYALLVTLYRGIAKGRSFMRKQELIDEAEESGLSRTSIGRDKGQGKPGQFGSTPRDWYTGWSCMKTLIDKGLIVKSSCPAKYMLTEEGKEAACECLLKSGLISSVEGLIPADPSKSSHQEQNASRSEPSCAAFFNQDMMLPFVDMGHEKEFIDIPNDTDMRILAINHIRTSDSDTADLEEEHPTSGSACISSGFEYSDAVQNPSKLQPCTTFGLHLCQSQTAELEDRANELAMPPHTVGMRFEEIYEVILVLDDRENFGSRFRKVIDGIRSQFKILVEEPLEDLLQEDDRSYERGLSWLYQNVSTDPVRRLPVGDGIWIARHRHSGNEYVLDFIVERKRIDDLCGSIRDNRYRDQKLRLLRCGLQKLIYLVEGDPNSSEASESIKTACFTTEILEGFDVQRTNGITDTVKKYGYLTQSISLYYMTQFPREAEGVQLCPTFDEFVKTCQDLEKMTVTDVFALQLMQVPQVTEEIALAVVKMYPTVVMLARAYSILSGDICAQEEMLKNKNNLITGAASRNIFRLVWGDR